MSVATAFTPKGNTITFTTSGTGSTAQGVLITPANLGLPTASALPTQVRMVNRGTTDVFVSFTPAPATISLPVAGTTTVGTPAPGIYLIPGIVEAFTLPTGDVVWMNNISTAVSQSYYVTFGEGM